MFLSLKRMFWSLSLLFSVSGCASGSFSPRLPVQNVRQHIASLGVSPTSHIVLVDTQDQTLIHLENEQIKKIYTVSTSKRGIGQKINTYRTPQGLHRINEKIGEGVPLYGIFNRRQYVGAAWQPQPRHQHYKDYISTRIIRLEGLQPGFNRGQDKRGHLVDSEQRAIYIHGTTMEWKLGSPSTKGCVHMSAKDMVQFFNHIPIGTLVWIN